MRQGTRRRLLHLFCWVAASFFACLSGTQSQDAGPAPIRVESHAVYVPVLVLDKIRIDKLQKMNPAVYANQLAMNNLDFEGVAVRGLLARDFQLFEDGYEQSIQSVTPDTQFTQPIQDNLGLYEDFVGAGGGIWVAPGVPIDMAAGMVLDVPPWPGYLIAYVPPGSAGGACHQVTVKVDRPNSLVLGRTQYCNAADPLKGTELGKAMQSNLASGKQSKIGLSLSAVGFFANTHAARVQISVAFTPNRITRQGEECYGLPEIRILGMIYRKDGSLAARFSDFTSRNFSPRGQAMPLLLPNSTAPVSCVAAGPSYETQVYLPPGDYRLQVALMDGKKFGRAEIPLTVDGYDGKHLAISGIALARRYRDASGGSDQMPTALPVAYVPLLSQGVELTPTADTTFDKTAPVYFYFEAFEPPSDAPPALTVQAHLRIADAITGQVKNDLKPVSAAPYMKPGEPVIPIGGGINIGNLPSGSYRLEVQATDSAGSSTPWHTANFTVQ